MGFQGELESLLDTVAGRNFDIAGEDLVAEGMKWVVGQSCRFELAAGFEEVVQ